MSRRLRVSRRSLLSGSAGLAAAAASGASRAASVDEAAPAAVFQSRWHDDLDRPWLGADYWAAPLQDWRVRDGAAECVNAAPNRAVHLLTADLADRRAGFTMRVKVGRPDGAKFGAGRGSAGFRLGIRGPLGEYRNALLYGKPGVEAGFTCDGTLFVGAARLSNMVPKVIEDQSELELRLAAEPDGGGRDFRVELELWSTTAGDERLLVAVRDNKIAAERLVGNVALVANFGGPESAGPKGKAAKKKAANASVPKATGPAAAGVGAFRFFDWTLSGAKVERHADRAFGPILFTQYTLSGGTLKLTAQLAPIGPHDSPRAALLVGEKRFEADVHPEARTATFRIDGWNSPTDVPYRVAYDLKSKQGAAAHEFTGTIRREPLDRPTLTVADISCNIHTAFPNTRYVEHLRKLDPDFLAFVGDQFYESTAGYGVTTAPPEAAVLDYLRKWYCHGWTWRDLTRDRPSISIPDDHDVYQGNIWGESGAPQKTTQEAGGYRMPGAWVNVVHRTQTSHHPDPYDPTPLEQGITQYYGRLVYGGVDFAILADRQYKTGPEGLVPPTGGRGDHVTDPKFDPKTADLPDLQLLGAKQEKFLAEWADDVRPKTVKAVVSQTIFTAMATTHGGPNGRLVADYDTNGWPQTARHRAVRLIRRACAFHIAGDQHLPAVVQYGADAPRDGAYAFAGPAVNVGYPRWWEPLEPGANRGPGENELLGDFLDSFGNHLRVVAVMNGSKTPRPTVLEQMTDKASGLGIVRFDKAGRRVTVECWPFDVDPTTADAKQFPGWPVTIDLPT